MTSYGICLSLSDLTSLSMIISRAIHVAANGIISLFFFYGSVVFQGIYVPHLPYPFICPWTFRLLPGLGCEILITTKKAVQRAPYFWQLHPTSDSFKLQSTQIPVFICPCC